MLYEEKVTSDFKDKTSYKEAVKERVRDKTAYIGSSSIKGKLRGKYEKQGQEILRREVSRTLEPYKNDIISKGENSVYIGCVLYPERTGVVWSIEENQGFIAAIIDSHRSVELVTDIEYFKYCGTTVYEMLWLLDNQYTFCPHQDGVRTIASPPALLKSPEERFIYDYQVDFESGVQEKINKIMLRFEREIRASVLEQRHINRSGSLPKSAPKAEGYSKEKQPASFAKINPKSAPKAGGINSQFTPVSRQKKWAQVASASSSKLATKSKPSTNSAKTLMGKNISKPTISSPNSKSVSKKK